MIQEEISSKEELVALAEIYLQGILDKLSPEQKVLATKMMIESFDDTNPLFYKFSGVTKTYIGLGLPGNAIDMRSGNYTVSCSDKIGNKLVFVKLLKELSGEGLREAKDATDSMPGIFAYNLTWAQANAWQKEFAKECYDTSEEKNPIYIKIGVTVEELKMVK